MPDVAPVEPAVPRHAQRALTEQLLESVVIDVWKQQIGRTLRRPPDTMRRPNGEFTVSASLAVDTGTSLIVSVRAPAEVATAVATSRLDLHEDELASGDIDDAFNDLLTVIAARLSHAMPGAGPSGPVGPSLVVQGSGLSVMVGGAELDCEVTLLAGTSPLQVSVWRPRAAAPANRPRVPGPGS